MWLIGENRNLFHRQKLQWAVMRLIGKCKIGPEILSTFFYLINSATRCATISRRKLQQANNNSGNCHSWDSAGFSLLALASAKSESSRPKWSLMNWFPMCNLFGLKWQCSICAEMRAGDTSFGLATFQDTPVLSLNCAKTSSDVCKTAHDIAGFVFC